MLSRATGSMEQVGAYKQGLNYVKSRIREAAAQAHPESPLHPNTYSWTAAFVLRASFAVSKAGVGA